MHHARHRQIHAVGAAIVERVRDVMREETAGIITEQVFFRHSAARQQGMPWYGLVGRRGFFGDERRLFGLLAVLQSPVEPRRLRRIQASSTRVSNVS